MKGLGVWMRYVGRFLLRCLVGKYGTILVASAFVVLVGAGAYLCLVYDNPAGSADQGTVYSVAAVDAHLAGGAGTWLGHTIQVRGEIVPCMDVPSAGSGPGAQRSVLICAELIPESEQIDQPVQSASPAVDPLSVVPAGLDPLHTILRRVPLLSRLVSAPQTLHWGVVATYRVRLAPIPDSVCGAGACVEARLLDSAP